MTTVVIFGYQFDLVVEEYHNSICVTVQYLDDVYAEADTENEAIAKLVYLLANMEPMLFHGILHHMGCAEAMEEIHQEDLAWEKHQEEKFDAWSSWESISHPVDNYWRHSCGFEDWTGDYVGTRCPRCHGWPLDDTGNIPF